MPTNGWLSADEGRIPSGMSPQTPQPDGNLVIVTTVARLRQIVDRSVEGAVQRALQVHADKHADARSDWVSTSEAVRVYGRSRSTLQRWSKAGMIKSRKIGGSRYYARPDFESD